ncbi:MAG: NADH-quinone oxidoreductase subunit M, partial [Chloroflexi bacterium]|nr:NADH-quinone oxidoreductase subunit M [Chloroflexota bacterium]
MFDGLLTITVFLPAAVGLLVAIFARGKNSDQQIRWISIGATVVTFVLTVVVFVGYDQDLAGVQMVDYL